MYNPQDKNVDLQRDYLPSCHTIRFKDQQDPSLAVQDHFIKLTTQHAEELKLMPNIKVDHLRYAGQEDRQVVDIFYKDTTPSSSPLFVFIHGGYWQMLDKIHSCSLVGPLVRRGCRVAVMDYNLCPQVTLEQLVEEFTYFLQWIFEYAEQTQATEINFAGHSAGGHLLAQLLNADSPVVTPERRQKVKALFFICGVYDLRELWSLEEVNPKNILDLNATKALDFSPICREFKKTSPSWQSTQLYVWTAQHESVTFIEQSREFAKVLQNAGFQVNFRIFENYDHFDIIEETANDESVVSQQLQLALKL